MWIKIIYSYFYFIIWQFQITEGRLVVPRVVKELYEKRWRSYRNPDHPTLADQEEWVESILRMHKNVKQICEQLKCGVAKSCTSKVVDKLEFEQNANSEIDSTKSDQRSFGKIQNVNSEEITYESDKWLSQTLPGNAFYISRFFDSAVVW